MQASVCEYKNSKIAKLLHLRCRKLGRINFFLGEAGVNRCLPLLSRWHCGLPNLNGTVGTTCYGMKLAMTCDDSLL